MSNVELNSYDTLDDFKQHPAYLYAKHVADGTLVSNKDIIIVCKNFLYDVDHQDEKEIFLDLDFINEISIFTNLLIMPNGVAVGKTVQESLAGFQWFFIINALCWKRADNHDKRRYESSVLLIGRKNGKTFLIALVFVILLLLEPEFSNFFSVAPDLELSTLIKDEMRKLISVSPIASQYFKMTKAEIVCIPTQSTFKPLATSNNRMDGKQKSPSLDSNI